ncbi:MAG: hypothetical protein K2K57_01665 [Oscillospiraceae bacterium]|nr:hypothetical protein [Oscillospiraceae bacterium]
MKIKVTQNTTSHNYKKRKNRAAVQHRTCGECRAFMLPPVRAHTPRQNVTTSVTAEP